MGNMPRWQKDSMAGVISPARVKEGEAVFSSVWKTKNAEAGPPSPLLLGRADGKGKPRVVTASIQEAGPAEITGYDNHLKGIPESQHRDHIVTSVSDSLYRALAVGGEANDTVEVKFKKADFWSRAKYVPGAKGALIAAAVTLIAAAFTAILAIVNSVTKPSAPLWVVAMAAGAVFLVAIIVFVVNVRDKTKPSAS